MTFILKPLFCVPYSVVARATTNINSAAGNNFSTFDKFDELLGRLLHELRLEKPKTNWLIRLFIKIPKDH